MPLTGKYLKYKPEITFEIFEKIYNKLNEEKWYCKNSIKTEYSWFPKYGYITHEEQQEQRNFATHTCIYGLEETTVQEILGYDPFVKEEFILPKNWRLKITKENSEIINNWRNNVKEISNTCPAAFIGENGLGTSDGWGIEITFDQFKQYILKEAIETPKEVIPEYVECIDSFSQFTKGKIYNWPEPKNNDNYTRTDINSIKIWENRFKPSTKEAFEAQNKPKDIIECEECNGTGEVMVGKLYPNGHTEVNEECPVCGGEGIIDKPKQPLKQAVHCKTQEEWDFVTEKLNYNWIHTKFKINRDCISLSAAQNSSEIYWKSKDYQILSFQEWCNLNGYKMENEVKFEVGKWYQYNPDVYLKFERIVTEKFRCSERIVDGIHSIVNSLYNTQSIMPISIEEIQQYLSADHVDKITSVIQQTRDMQSEFKVGDWIVANSTGWNDTAHKQFKTVYKQNELMQIKSFSKMSNGQDFNVAITHSGNVIYIDKYKEKFRHATPEEINNHLISIGQILSYSVRDRSTDDLSNYGLPTEPPSYMYEMKQLEKHNSKPISAEVEFNYLPEPK